MFGADVDLESLTDSDDDYDSEKDAKEDVETATEDLKQAKFKIVSGEDSDSMFEERLQQDGKFEDMDYGDYDDEDWGLDGYDEMNEQAPE